MTVLSNRKQGPNDRNDGMADPLLQTGGIIINQDAYDSSLDRIYNVKGFKDAHSGINNDGASGLVYTIEGTRKEYQSLTTLVDTDFDDTILADTIVAAAAKNNKDIVDITPETTAIRVRIRRETAGVNTTLSGIFSAQ